MNKRIKMAAGGGIFALALAVAGGGYYYFHTQKDTPAYAIKTVSKSIEDHDVKEFHRVVNVDSVLDSGYDGFVDGMTSPGIVATSDARETIKNFTQILHAPLMLSLKAAIDSYIETGELNKEENASVKTLIERTGFDSFEYRGIDSVEINPRNSNEATAKVRIYQPELAQEFVFNIIHPVKKSICG